MEVRTALNTGDPYTDALVEGPAWNGLNITYSFPTSSAQFTGYSGGEPFNNFEGLSAFQQLAVRLIFGQLSSFTNLTFTELSGTSAEISSATLRFGMTDDMDFNAVAHAYLPSTSPLGGDSWYRNTGGFNDDPQIGTDAWHTFLHEIGHTLGLGHPHESVPAMPADRDRMAYTVMSYEGYPSTLNGWAQTYMMQDIAALQFLYGANFNHNSSNSTYRWNQFTGEMTINGLGQGAPAGGDILMTIWDGGGVDTYDFSNYPELEGVFVIDLAPGAWTSLAPGAGQDSSAGVAGNIANALLFNGDVRSLIENAVGSSGSDHIFGNAAANSLSGGPGNDVLYGLEGADTLIGGLGIDQVSGGEGDDTLLGGDGGDYLHGDEGLDALDGGAGDDHLFGGSSADQLDGGDGNDRLEGGDGADTLRGGLGDDTYVLTGGPGADQIVEAADQGIDTVESSVSFSASQVSIERIFLTGDAAINAVGNASANRLGGNHSANTLDGGAGADIMRGGYGDDIYYVDNVGDQVAERANSGTDTVYSSANIVLLDRDPEFDPYAGASISPFSDGNNEIEFVILTGSGSINATGNAFANTLKGNSGANRISGMGGDDTISGGGGSDELIGGAGADVFAYAAASDSTVAQEDWLSDFVSGTDKIDLRSILATGVSYQALDGATRITVTTQSGVTMAIRAAGAVSAADILFGTTPVPTPTPTPLPTPTHTGGPGNDTVMGSSGNDVIDGGAGGDWMEGGLGDDIYIADSQSDVARESSAAGGTDTVYSSVKFSLSKNVENLTLIGDAPVTASGNDLANILTGNSANNLIKGGLGNDTMYGGAGDDALVGGPGVDTMFGGVGDDSYYLDEGGDIINELAGEGTDTIVASTSFSLGAHVENLILTGTANLNGSGNGLDNVITGNAGANTLKGGSGVDTLNGGDGDDILNGGLGADTLDGGLGDDLYYIDDAGDVIYDDGGNDTVYSSVSLSLSKTIEHLTLTGAANINGSGNDLNNFLAGNAGDNTLKGGNGKDTLFGGLGADVLLGGAGQDKFFFDTAIGGANVDQLLDFSAADDTIYLDRSIFGGLATGLLASDAFRLGTSAVDADDRILYDSATGSIWYDADGSGAGAAVHFASVTPGVQLSNYDFFAVV